MLLNTIESQPAVTAINVEPYRLLFQEFATAVVDGKKFMTRDDFLAAVAPGEDFKKIQREQFALLFRIADKSASGLLSLEDFAVFEDLLTKPDAEYEIAFKFFDRKNTGKITYADFKQILSTNLAPDAVPFDFDCEWIKLYVGGKDAKHELPYAEFSQLLKGLQSERLRQEFRYYDPKSTGEIDAASFQKIVLDISKHKLSDSVLERLPSLCTIYPGNNITYANVTAFHNVIKSMDMVERIIRRAIEESPDKKINKADFLNTAAHLMRYSFFTPMEVDIIFHFAGTDASPDGRLQLTDFSKLLDPKWQRAPLVPHPESDEIKPKSILKLILHGAYSFALGSIAGAVGATAVYPIDLVKTRMQNQRSKVVGELMYKNSIDCFKKVVKNEGVLGLYRGLGPQLVGVAPEKAIKLTVNDLVRGKVTDPETGKIKLRYEFLAGGTAGACQVIFTNPLEIVKIRLQIQGEEAKISGIPRRSAVWIVRTLGLLGLYKGVSACLLRDIPFSAIYFPAYAHLKKNMFKEGPGHKLSIGELLLAGAIAGMPAAYFTTPADVIKTRLQVEARKGQTTYNGIFDAGRKIYAEEGFRAFFKGGPARILRSSPQFGVTLMTYELLQRWLPFDGKKATADTESDVVDLGLLRSRNALKMLLDLDYRFGVYNPGLAKA